MSSARLLVVGRDIAASQAVAERLLTVGFKAVRVSSADHAPEEAAKLRPEAIIAVIAPTETVQETADEVRQDVVAVRTLLASLQPDPCLIVGLLGPEVDSEQHATIQGLFDDAFHEPAHTMQLRDRINRLIRLGRMKRESNRRWRTAQRFTQWNEKKPLDLSLVSDSDEESIAVPRVVIWAPHGHSDGPIARVIDRVRSIAVVHVKRTDEETYQTLLEGDADLCLLAFDGNIDQALTFIAAARNSATLFNVPIVFCLTNPVDGAIDRAFAAGASDIVTGEASVDDIRGSIYGLMKLEQFRRTLIDSFQTAPETQIRDSVTGLYTFGFVMDYIDQLIGEARQQSAVFSLGLCEFVGLAEINRTCGYTGGDYALRRLAQLMERAVRVEDLVGRLGGSKFLLALPDTDMPRAQIAFGRLGNVMRYTTIDMPGAHGALGLKTSFASIQWNGEETAEALMRRLFAAKPARAAAA